MFARQLTSRLFGKIVTGLGAALIAVPALAAEYQLVMYEQNGCHFCERWLTEIGPAYPKTAEGQIAPLRMVNIHDAPPADLAPVTYPVFTPTFVLMENGAEVGRIEGYAGEELFWWMMATLIRDHVPDADNGQ